MAAVGESARPARAGIWSCRRGGGWTLAGPCFSRDGFLADGRAAPVFCHQGSLLARAATRIGRTASFTLRPISLLTLSLLRLLESNFLGNLLWT